MAWPTHIVAAGGYVFDGKGNVLLVRTRHRGWDCTGGQVEAGENLEEAVLREILEESGITASVRHLAAVYSNVGQHLFYDGKTHVPTKILFGFICDYISGEPRPSDENEETIWAPREKVFDYVTAMPSRYQFQSILRFDGRVKYASYISKPDFKLLSERYI